MCDEEINQGISQDPKVSRRVVMMTGLVAAGVATTGMGENVVEKDVSVTTPDGTADAALFYPQGKGKWPAVLVWPDILGLRPVFREMGRRLAAAGYVVLVPNPFYRSKRAPVMEGTVDFSNREAMSTLMGYRKAIPDAGIDTDAKAYLAFLDTQPQTNKARKAGVQGYCMGGPLAFHTGAAVANRIGGVATFHGGGLVTDDASSPHLLIPKTNAAFLVDIAQNDDKRQPDAKDKLKAAFAAAKRPAQVEVFPADHGWTVAGSQVYDQASAERAWAGLMQFYKTRLV